MTISSKSDQVAHLSDIQHLYLMLLILLKLLMIISLNLSPDSVRNWLENMTYDQNINNSKYEEFVSNPPWNENQILLLPIQLDQYV